MWNKKEEICFEFDLAGTKLSNQSDCIINISYDSKTMRGE
jgi:hypothetical protein